MNEDPVLPPTEVESPEKQSPSDSSPKKIGTDIKKEKKMKSKALKDFLKEPKGDIIEILPRREEEQVQPERNETEAIPCKICGTIQEQREKRKKCQFCRDVVCLEHIRKKRKDKNTNKFVRICDDCEDKYLFDKYMKFESKAEEAIVMQEMIIATKRDEMMNLADSKKIKLQMLLNKKKELQEEKKQNENKIRLEEKDYASKAKRAEAKFIENDDLELELKKLEQSLPRPLDDDYNCLVEQNNKINKELLKYEKLCSEALKAKSTREKELYEAYHNWEKKESARATAKQKEQCVIY